MDLIIPGGISINLTQEGIAVLKNEIYKLQLEVNELCDIFRDHGGLQDRFAFTGTVNSGLATQLGLIGLSARASRRQIDWRKQMTHEPYDQLEINYPFESSGDVAARVLIRFKELTESFRAMRQILDKLPDGEIQIALPKLSGSHKGFGCVEGWRGPVFAGVCIQADQLLWGHMHDPSWQNWPALEYAVIGNIVPDFPLINKSFNLSYSGHDS
jgi:Ni,Fe-hydrogenase III large subunit